MLTRRNFVSMACAPGLARAARRRKPNLLYLLADDHAGYVLGADGNRMAQTPNLDRLAGEGVRFAGHYCNSPVCTPSRQSFFTSLMPHAAGVTVLGTALRDDRPTLARQLSASGYRTAVIGKMHFNAPGRAGLHGFDVARTEDVVQKEWSAWAGPHADWGEVRTKPAWRPFRDPARIWLNADKLPYPRAYAQMKGTWVAQQAAAFLAEHRSDPFALWVSFTEPHSPFDFPVEARNDFDPARFTPPTVGPEDGRQIPLIFRELSNSDKQGIIAAYYSSVRYLDRNIGVVLDALRRLDLENDTLVVYMADHGYCLGQHGRFEKHCSYDPALRVPLIFRLPGRLRPRVVRDFTESIDVPPTIVELLGAERFAVNHGQSLVPYLKGARPARPRSSTFAEYLENEEACVRTAKWKFVHSSGRRARTDGYKTDHPTPGRIVRLYDLEADPGEFHNVAAEHPEVVRELSRAMLGRFRTTHPEAAQAPAMEDADAIEWYLRPRDAV
ncbi:MAG: sulfatase-like hydrolase/transferase [Acidobacteria bacterium]|nr:sulfatase-like hydrolase/transferase [Acidobacteriota bacterium]